MHALYVDGLTIRPLRNGDADTIAALCARLGDQPHEKRFCGIRPHPSDSELHELARVDDNRHTLVGYVDGDPEPAAIARLFRDGTRAKVAFAVADVYQGRGFGSTLGRELAADARAAGIRELVATVCGDSAPIVSL